MELQIMLFVFWGFLWAAYFMLDGFDFGVGLLLSTLGRTDSERQAMIHAISPVWNGNEVWLITAGAVTFAAFPAAYAGIFSGFYSLIALTIAALIFRGVVFEFRGRLQAGSWRDTWDAAFMVGSIVPAFLFGVIFGNLFRGLELDAAGVHNSLLSFFNFYGLLTGVLFLVLFAHHGSLWLALKAAGDGLARRAETTAGLSWSLLIAAAAAFAVLTYYMTGLYDTYLDHPGWFILPAVVIGALAADRYFLLVKNYLAAFLASSLTISAFVAFGAVGLYPNLAPSRIDDAYSLSISNSAASSYALGLMAVMIVIFVPLVIGYQLWVYGVFKGRLAQEDEAGEEGAS